MELAQLAYVARHFPVNVVNTLINNFELSPDVFKIFHFPNWPWSTCLTALPFQPLYPFQSLDSSRSCWSCGARRSRRPLKSLISFFTFSGFQYRSFPFCHDLPDVWPAPSGERSLRKNIKPSGRIFKLTHHPFPELAQNSVPLC
jgi:hypothetical protein